MNDTPMPSDQNYDDIHGAEGDDTGASGMDFGGLMASAQEAMSARAEAAQRTVEGTSGGGVVRVTMTGRGEVTEVTLAPEVVDPEDIEMLQDLIVAALSDANTKVTDMQREATMSAFGQLNLGAIGGDLGNALNSTLGGLLGGGGEGLGGPDEPPEE